MKTYPITGVFGGVDNSTGARPARLNIVDLQNSGPAWDLYIQAFQNFTMDPSTELTSFFQVAGIHGYPNIAWDGEQGNGGGIGYCTHGSILFPTWHRPYMALFEQIVWEKAQYIATLYPASQQDTYVAAAETLRIPFWDWTMQVGFPQIVNTTTLTINTPTGQQTIANPLYSYTIPDTSGMPNITPNGEKAYTVRNDGANKTLTMQASSFHSNMYQLMSRKSDFLHFADAGIPQHHFGIGPPPSLGPLSMESQHNNIHMSVGQTMADLTIAAFDPVFWLHHANVDRIFAIYQAIHPDDYVTPFASSAASYSTPKNTTEDVNSPLYPFHSDDQGTLYTSATSRTTAEFGYTYPEVADWGVNADPASLTANVTAIINRMYNPKATSNLKRDTAPGLSDGNAAKYNWMINTVADTSELADSLFIYFYVTTPPTDSASWATDSSVLAITPILVNHAAGPNHGMIIGNQASVSGRLMAHVSDVDPSVALPALKANLQWRAAWANGSVISFEDMESFQAVNITLAGQTVQQPASITDFPEYGDLTTYGQVNLGANATV
ncbi:hypothetical protein ANO11243_071540 [Dothideomycetidae sp. 11243]|nr:hypothetical protein ANO11243_071540 [fungal sp. No.11243]